MQSLKNMDKSGVTAIPEEVTKKEKNQGNVFCVMG